MVPPGGVDFDTHFSDRAAERDHVDALALAYRAGRGDLGELYRAVEPTFKYRLNQILRQPMPTLLDADDIRQQSWLIVDRLARRWDPAEGAFGAYVRVSFWYEMHRLVRLYAPRRRSLHVHVSTLPEEDWDATIRHQVGADGREWDGQLAVVEMLETLDVDVRQVVALRALCGLSVAVVADRLGITRGQQIGRYHRGIERLRLALGVEQSSSVEHVVTVLHALVERTGRLPGRAIVCREAGISEVLFNDLMRALAARGAIVGRSERSTGRLAYATPEATLSAIGAA